MQCEYPKHVTDIDKSLVGKQCLYVLEVEPNVYKFGITGDINTRLKTHYRDMKFVSVKKIYDCAYADTMRRVENKVKTYAKGRNELMRKYNKTEIIGTHDINGYLQFITEEIDTHNKNRTAKPIPVKQPVNTNAQAEGCTPTEREMYRGVINSLMDEVRSANLRITELLGEKEGLMDELIKYMTMLKERMQTPTQRIINIDTVNVHYSQCPVKDPAVDVDEFATIVMKDIVEAIDRDEPQHQNHPEECESPHKVWVKANPPANRETTTDYYKRYVKNVNEPFTIQKFTGTVVAEGYERRSNGTARYWVKK